MIKVSSLRVIPNEFVTISKENMDKLKKIIAQDDKFIKTRRIVVDMSQDGLVLAGNIKVKAIKLLGMEEIPESWVNEVSHCTEETKKMHIFNELMIEALHLRCIAKHIYIKNETAPKWDVNLGDWVENIKKIAFGEKE